MALVFLVEGIPYFLLSVIVVIVFSGSCVDVILQTDVISVMSVVLTMSLRTIGTESRERFNRGSDSQLLPSSQFLASGPNLRISAYEISPLDFTLHSVQWINLSLPVIRLLFPSMLCGNGSCSSSPRAIVVPTHILTNHDDFSTSVVMWRVYVCPLSPADCVSFPPTENSCTQINRYLPIGKGN